MHYIPIYYISGQLNCILLETYHKIIQNNEAAVEITVEYNEAQFKIIYELKLDKDFIPYKTLCKPFPFSMSSAKVSSVEIKLVVDKDITSSVAWRAKSVKIPNYEATENVQYSTYSLAPPEPQFWVSTDAKCEELSNDFNMLPCCVGKKSCRLYSKGKIIPIFALATCNKK